jgi:hypothetical protein
MEWNPPEQRVLTHAVCVILVLQVHLLEAERAGRAQRLQTEGINFAGLWEQQLLLDVNK